MKNKARGSLSCLSVFLLLGFFQTLAHADLDAGPHLENITDHSVQLLYEGDSSDGNGEVEYGPTPDYGLSTTATKRPLMDEWYLANLTGLAPASQCYYRLTHEGELKEGWFFTPPTPGDPFTFAVIGDTQSGGAQHQAIIDAVLDNGYPDLLFHPGDKVSDGSDKDQWQDFFAKEDELLRHTILGPAQGNHDQGLFGNYFAPGETYTFWHGFPYGNAYFILLNTEQPTAGAQKDFLLNQLIQARSNPDIDFVFVFFHQPGVTTSTGHDPNPWVLLDFLDLFEAYNVDAVFNGHNHVYEHGIVNGVHHIVSGAASSSLYDLIEPYTPQGWTIVYRESVYHYCYVTVSGDSYTFQARYQDGTTFDSYTATTGEGGVQGPTPQDLLDRALDCGGCDSRHMGSVQDVDASTGSTATGTKPGFTIHLLLNSCLYGFPALFIVGVRRRLRRRRSRQS